MPKPNIVDRLARLADGQRFLPIQVAAILVLAFVAYLVAGYEPTPVPEPVTVPADQKEAVPTPTEAETPAPISSLQNTGGDTRKKPPLPTRTAAGERDVLEMLADNRDQYGTIPNEYLVRFATEADMQAFLRQAVGRGLQVLDSSLRLLTVRFHTGDITTARDFLNSLHPVDLDENTEVIIPDEPDLALAPPLVSYQGFGGRALQWLGVEDTNRAWGDGVVVAVLDTLVGDHPALSPDRIVRLDLLDDSNDDGSGALAGHGTAVAALIAGNGGEVAGMAPQADILAIRVLDSHGRGDGFTVAKGIIAAVDNGADVINLSLGSYGDSHALAAAVQYALERGVAVVAATGNDGLDQVMYPARYQGVIGVGAVDAANQYLAFSNFGEGTDIAAPGFEVTTAWNDGRTVAFSGTSAAAPFVSGAIAALLSADPQMSPAEAARLTLAYANDAGQPGADEQFGRGILNWRRITDRQTPGIYDLAVADYYLPDPTLPAAGDAMPVVVTIQNRGTEYIDTAQVAVTVGGVTEYHEITDLAPNESTGILTSIPRNRITATGLVTVSSVVSSRGLDDQFPANDELSDDFIFVEMCPYIK